MNRKQKLINEIANLVLLKLNEGAQDDLLSRYEAGDRDFSGIDLRGADLGGITLKGIDLSFADLQGAILKGGYQYATLKGTNMKEVRAVGCIFDGADLTEANLSEAIMRGASLRNADLVDANLQGADLRNVDLSNANLYGVNLRNANLQGADLRSALNLETCQGLDTIIWDEITIWPSNFNIEDYQ